MTPTRRFGDIEDAFSYETQEGRLEIVAWSDGQIAVALTRGDAEEAHDFVVRNRADLEGLLASVGISHARITDISRSLWSDEIEPRYKQWGLLD